MCRKLKKSTSFFKVLSAMDFTHLPRLPPFFLQKYGLILPEDVKLRISSGKTWDVKVEQIENGPFCFTQGWKNFAEDVGLKFGEFLVFMFDCKFIFDVSIYETSACEREFPSRSFHVEDSVSDEGNVELIEDECEIKNHIARSVINRRESKARKNGGKSKFNQNLEENSQPLYFEMLLKLHHESRISLPKKFWTGADLMRKETVALEYASKHDYQKVVLDHRSKYRIDMAKGWPKFRKANGLSYGKTYSFEFESSKNVIKVKEVNEGN